eukprot:CAMPEP_0201576990 /NCGR_PEP_ID=MMETSP0190_2-20130828/23145_1 /ASSEMBLY_ACC=CAM_ASM_000263 /TAXON_ID=37353 /ORGANISM="Rosalina sp." /LENGTH=381 /DNA_ID=CAMNT_0048008535 /DNA_START=112 /DNA_END=1258 /DNA_ORIENTATION=+
MTDPNNKPSGHTAKPPPPPWANARTNRRHTMNIQAPPKPVTASSRASRYAPNKPISKPPPSATSAYNKSPKTKSKRPPPKPYSNNNDNNISSDPIASKKRNSPPKPKRKAGTYKPSPLALGSSNGGVGASTFDAYKNPSKSAGALLESGDSPDTDPFLTKAQTIAFTSNVVPSKMKRSSLQHSTLSQVMSRAGKPRPKPTNNKSRKSKSPPPVSTISTKTNPYNKNAHSGKTGGTTPVSRWGNHPHAKLFTQTSHSESDDEDDAKRVPPPAPPTVKPRQAVYGKAKPWNDTDYDDLQGGMSMFGGKKKKPKGKINKSDKDEIVRRYSKNIAGFQDNTLKEIDKSNIEALLACMHEGSECMKQFQSALSTFANNNKLNVQTF